MNEHTRHQIVRGADGSPLFALVPWEEYERLMEDDRGRPDEEVKLPLKVVELNIQQGLPLIRAWREFRGMTQQQVADAMGIKQPSYAAMEAEGANLRPRTLQRIAEAMSIEWEQLRED